MSRAYLKKIPFLSKWVFGLLNEQVTHQEVWDYWILKFVKTLVKYTRHRQCIYKLKHMSYSTVFTAPSLKWKLIISPSFFVKVSWDFIKSTKKSTREKKNKTICKNMGFSKKSCSLLKYILNADFMLFKIRLYWLGWPGTCYVDKAGLGTLKL